MSFRSNVGAVLKAFDAVADERIKEAANAVRNEAVKTLSGSRSGRRYRVPGTRRTYTASAPGEPPAVRLGQLRSSVRFKITKSKKQIKAQVGTPLRYGAMLERGTRTTAPRPWLKPSFRQAKSEVERIFARRWF